MVGTLPKEPQMQELQRSGGHPLPTSKVCARTVTLISLSSEKDNNRGNEYIRYSANPTLLKRSYMLNIAKGE